MIYLNKIINFNKFENQDVSISCQNGLFGVSFDAKPPVKDKIYLNLHALSEEKVAN